MARCLNESGVVVYGNACGGVVYEIRGWGIEGGWLLIL